MIEFIIIPKTSQPIQSVQKAMIGYNNFILKHEPIIDNKAPTSVQLIYNKKYGKEWIKEFIFHSTEIPRSNDDKDTIYLKKNFGDDIEGFYTPKDDNLLSFVKAEIFETLATKPGNIYIISYSEVYIILIGGGIVDPLLKEKLDKNIKLWNSFKYTQYEFDLDITCFCSNSRKRRIQVINNEIKQPIINLDSKNDKYIDTHNRTIIQLFEFIEQELYKSPDKITISYDDKYGFISKVEIDDDDKIADEEIAYEITNFKIIEIERKLIFTEDWKTISDAPRILFNPNLIILTSENKISQRKIKITLNDPIINPIQDDDTGLTIKLTSSNNSIKITETELVWERGEWNTEKEFQIEIRDNEIIELDLDNIIGVEIITNSELYKNYIPNFSVNFSVNPNNEDSYNFDLLTNEYRLLTDAQQKNLSVITGVVKYNDLKGGFYEIQKDNEIFLPINIQNDLINNLGKKIEITKSYTKLEINKLPHFVIKNSEEDSIVNNYNIDDENNKVTFEIMGITKDLPPSIIELNYQKENGNIYRLKYEIVNDMDRYLNNGKKCVLKYFTNGEYQYYVPQITKMLRCYNLEDPVTEDFIMGRINIITKTDSIDSSNQHYIKIEDLYKRFTFPDKYIFNLTTNWNQHDIFNNLFTEDGNINESKIKIGEITIFSENNFEQEFVIKDMKLDLLNESQKNDIIDKFKSYYLETAGEGTSKIDPNKLSVTLNPGSVNIRVKISPFLYSNIFTSSGWYLFGLPTDSPSEGLSLVELYNLYNLLYVENTCWELDEYNQNYINITDNTQKLKLGKGYWIQIKIY
jgi:hypothetical protein